MEYATRTDARERLVAELRSFAEDREAQGKHERAQDARRAIAELEAGADSTQFERTCYAVGPRDRSAAIRGTRDEIATDLRATIEGAEHLGTPELAESARIALQELEAGAETVRAGHIAYEVR